MPLPVPCSHRARGLVSSPTSLGPALVSVRLPLQEAGPSVAGSATDRSSSRLTCWSCCCLERRPQSWPQPRRRAARLLDTGPISDYAPVTIRAGEMPRVQMVVAILAQARAQIQWSPALGCNTTISACEKGQRPQHAMRLLQGVPYKGIPANVIAIIAHHPEFGRQPFWSKKVHRAPRWLSKTAACLNGSHYQVESSQNANCTTCAGWL